MQDGIDSRYAWLRLSVTLTLMTIGATGMFVISVALPAVQADFGIDRSSVSTAYTSLMIGFGLGGILMGRLADRFGVAVQRKPADFLITKVALRWAGARHG